jgi:hypothetical protein
MASGPEAGSVPSPRTTDDDHDEHEHRYSDKQNKESSVSPLLFWVGGFKLCHFFLMFRTFDVTCNPRHGGSLARNKPAKLIYCNEQQGRIELTYPLYD